MKIASSADRVQYAFLAHYRRRHDLQRRSRPDYSRHRSCERTAAAAVFYQRDYCCNGNHTRHAAAAQGNVPVTIFKENKTISKFVDRDNLI